MAIKATTSKTVSKFFGTVYLRSQEDADRLAVTVNRIVKSSANLFYNLKNNRNATSSLLADMDAMLSLLGQYPELVEDAQTRERVETTLTFLHRNKDALKEQFQALPEHGAVSDEQAQVITSRMKSILDQLAVLSNIMDDAQILRVKRACKRAAEALVFYRDAPGKAAAGSLLNVYSDKNLRYEDLVFLTRILDVQIGIVAEDNPHREQLKLFNTTLKEHVPQLDAATEAILQAGGTSDVSEQQEHIIALAKTISEVSSLVEFLRPPPPEASYERRLIIEALEQLRKNVSLGPAGAKAAAVNAREIANLLETSQWLANSLQHLKEVTYQLVAATKEAITSPEQGNAKFDKIVDEMKGLVEKDYEGDGKAEP